MKVVTRFIGNTIVGGILFLVPIIVLLAILGKAHKITSRLVVPLAERMPFESIVGFSTPRFMAVAVIVLFCFLAGLLAKTALARRSVNKLEGSLLSKIPGYTLVKGMVESVAGTDVGLAREVVLARIEDAWQVGIVIERIEPGYAAVFIPDPPDPRAGSMYILTEDRFKVVDLPMGKAFDLVRGAGKGSGTLLRGKL